MNSARVQTAAAVSAATGILAAILGGWLTAKWLWGVAALVLILIATTAGAEVIKVRAEENSKRNEAPEERNQPQHQVSIGVGAVAGNFSARKSVIAGGDVTQTNVTKKYPTALLTLVCLGALFVYAAGTILLGREPGGLFHPTSPATGSVASDNPPEQFHYHLAATYEEANSNGDSITQTISFGSPAALSALPDVARAAQSACLLNVPSLPLDRDLVIPFQIVSTLHSSLPVSVPVALNIDDFYDSTFSDSGGLYASLPGITEEIGQYGSQLACDAGANNLQSEKPAIVLRQPGKVVTFDGWLIFPDQISPDQPHGNTIALGRTYAQLDFSLGTTVDNIKVIGPGVCNGEIKDAGMGNGPQNVNAGNPPFLHIGGPMPGWEGCSGYFHGSPS